MKQVDALDFAIDQIRDLSENADSEYANQAMTVISSLKRLQRSLMKQRANQRDKALVKRMIAKSDSL
jgi:anaerobic ribonucleoside-triphosphate reductase